MLAIVVKLGSAILTCGYLRSRKQQLPCKTGCIVRAVRSCDNNTASFELASLSKITPPRGVL